jgi:quinol-cytochrome oxidoreductase complex cytochrome b subunit
MRVWSLNTVTHIIDILFIKHRSPIFLGYLWNFGVFSFLCLFIQIFTGLFLAMHYIPDTLQAFGSVEHIMRDVNNGWFLRYTHANGASFFFIAVYIHMFRGLYYGSFTEPRQAVWYVGSVILLLMILTAFLGYVLPWGQMSYWAATVITNMLSALPIVGKSLVTWVWGGYSVGAPTLTRFYALHFLLPMVLVVLVFYHVYLLHQVGSNSPLGIEAGVDDKPFYPYYIAKDIFAIILFFLPFAFIIFFYPNTLGHPDNYIPANPLVTPSHIVPEWYFLPFYAILRSIPDKVLGVLAMGFSIVSLALVPAVQRPFIRSLEFRPISRVVYWWFLHCCLVLGWIGSQLAKYPYVQIGQAATFFYFFYFWALMPAVIYFENTYGRRRKRRRVLAYTEFGRKR